MIFVTVGSQKFQFDRLLKEIDRLVESSFLLGEDVFAQIGYSTYIPKNYKYKKFLSSDEFIRNVDQSHLIITHGGTGSIINSIKRGKKVIAIPRLSDFGEHVDDHQLEIVNQFTDSKVIYSETDINKLRDGIKVVATMTFNEYKSNTHNIIRMIEDFIIAVDT